MNCFSMTDCFTLKNKAGVMTPVFFLVPLFLLTSVSRTAAQAPTTPGSSATIRSGEKKTVEPGGLVFPPFAGSVAPLFEVLKRGDNPLHGAALSRGASPRELTNIPNPNLVISCPTDIIMILDESASIVGQANGSSNISPQVRAGAYSFAQAFNSTGSRLAIVEFSTAAQSALIGGAAGFKQINNGYLADLNKYLYAKKDNKNDDTAYDPEDYAGLTNWQAAFDAANSLIANNDPTPPLVVFFTDGEPTLPANGALDAAMVAADQIKAKGAHLFVVALNNPAVPEANVEAITDGVNSMAYNAETSDFSKADFVVLGANSSPVTFDGTLYDAFTSLAGSLCQVDVSLTKTINNTQPVFGNIVNFTLTLSNSPDADMPATSLSVTDYLPPGYEYKAATIGYDAMGTGAMIVPVESGAPLLLWTIDQLDAGETVKLFFKATVLQGSAEAGDYLNRAEITELDQVDTDSDVTDSFNNDDKDDNAPDDDEATAEASPVSCDGFYVTAYPVGPGCTGYTKGSITYFMTGGTPKFDISWDGPLTNDGVLNGLESGHKVQGMSVGTYQITVTDSKGCTFTMTVTIAPPPPVTLSSTVISAFCSGAATDAINLTVSGGVPPYNYKWSNGAKTEDILNLTDSLYCVTVTDAVNCTATRCDTISPPFQVVAAAKDIINCKTPIIQLDGTGTSTGPDLAYQWTTPNGFIVSGANTLQPSVIKAGTYILTVTKLSTGCTGTASVTVNADQNPPLANAGPPQLFTCSDTLVQLKGSGSIGPNFSIQWTANPGTIASGANTFTPTVSQAGVYNLIVTNQTNGCSGSATVIIGTDQNLPTVNAGPALSLSCADKTIQLQGSGSTGPGYVVQWTAIPGFIVAGANTFTPTINQIGKYQLTVTNLLNGCSNQATVNVTGNFSAPMITITPPGMLTCIDTVVQIAAGAVSQGTSLLFNWTTTTGHILSGANTPNLLVDKGGIYKLTVTNTSSGCSSSASVMVQKDNTPPFVYAGANATLNCKIAKLTLNGSVSGNGLLTYNWQTNGGHFVSGANTLHPVVDSAGTYTLVATNGQNGCQAQSTVTVNADYNTPQAQAGADKQLSCANPTVKLDGTGSTTGAGISYQWAANPGSILSGANTINNALVNAAGRYTLVVVNTVNGCTASDDADVTSLINLPLAAVAGVPPLTCVTKTVTLNATASTQGPGITYAWSTTNGHVAAGQGTLTPQVDKPGTYQLVVTNPNNGCTASATVTVKQDITPPAAVIAPVAPLTCVTVQLQLNATGSSSGSPFNYQWATTNGNLVSGQTTLSPTVDKPGAYTLTVLNVENGCTATANVTVPELKVIPVASTSVSQDLTCALKQLNLNGIGSSLGSAYSYVWHTQDGNIVSGVNTLVPVVNAPGTYQLIVVHKQSGCTASSSVTVGQNIIPPVAATAAGDALTCTIHSVTLDGAGSSAGPGFSYQWNGPTGAIVSGQGTLNPVVVSPGVYHLVVTSNLNGCTASSSATVTVDVGVPKANAGPPDTLNCVVHQLSLDGSASSTGPEFTYSWTGPGVVSGPNTLAPVVDAPGIYRIVVTDTTNGCTAVSGVLVSTDLVDPVADAGLPGVLNCGVTVLKLDGSKSSTGAPFRYLWTASAGGNIVSGNNSLQPEVDRPGTYTLLVTNLVNGCTATDAVTISEDKAPPTANAGAPGLITCTQSMVALNGSGSSGPGFSIQWLTSNGSIVAGANTFNPVVDAPGDYQLVVTNMSNHCTATAATQVTKDVNVPVAAILPPDTLNCVVKTLQLDGAASSSGANIQFNWMTANGHFLSDSTLTPLVDAPGQYTLHILNTSNNCEAQFTVNVEQDLNPPLADAGAPAVLSCAVPVLSLDGSGSSQGAFFAYQWTSSFTGHILSGPNSLSPEVDRSGQYTLIVTDTRNGCFETASVLILLDQDSPEAEAGQDMALTCIFDTVMISGGAANPNYNYQWTASAGGHIVSGGNGTQLVVDEPGTYTLMVLNPSNGCSAADSVTVTRDITPPQAVVAPPAILDCQNHESVLNTTGSSNGPMYYYTWTTTGGNILSGAYGPAPVVDKPGDYQLLILNILNGCTATAATAVGQDITLPVAGVGTASQLNCAVKVFALQGNAMNTGSNPEYAWETTGGNILSGGKTLDPVIDAPGIYLLTVTNTDNHCTATAEATVTRDTIAPLAAAATASPLTCVINEVTLFAAGSSAGPLFSYRWTPQNGGNILSGDSTLAPTVNAAGDYLLTVTNTHNQCTATASTTVELDTLAPAANAGSQVMLNCKTPALQLDGSGSSTGIGYSYLWDTSDGLILSGENTLNPVIGTPGTYTLLVTNLLNGCNMTDTVSADEDMDAPHAAVGIPDVLTCVITELTLQGMDNDSIGHNIYHWSTATGQISAGAGTLSPTVTAPGDYLLLVTDTLNGCTAEAVASVYQNIAPPQLSTLDPDTLNCAIKETTLLCLATAASGKNISYQWTTQNGKIVSGADGPEPVVSAAGLYTVTVTDLYNSCTGTAAVAVPIDVQPPKALVAPPGLLTCVVNDVTLDASGSAQGNQFAYTWNGPSVIAGGGTLAPVVNQPGQYFLEVFNLNNSCSSTAATLVAQDIQPPVAEAGPAFELNCSVSEVYLDAKGSSTGSGFSYWWSTTDGNILSDPTEPKLLVDLTGVYFLQVTNTSNGCVAVDLTIVSENTNYPSALKMFTDPPGCDGKAGMIRIEEVQGGTGPYVYSIDNGATFRTSNQFDQLYPGHYTLIVQDANGCEYEETLDFPELPDLNVQLGPDIELEFGASATLTAHIDVPYSEIDTVIWSPADQLTLTKDLFTVIIEPYSEIVYTVTVINKYGCEDRSSVVVRLGDPRLWAPNAISPNHEDGKNDVFLIFAAENTVERIKTLQIYDRWGNMVFRKDNSQPNDEKHGWDGFFQGQPLNPGVFVWWADVELLSGQRILMKGDVTIVD